MRLGAHGGSTYRFGGMLVHRRELCQTKIQNLRLPALHQKNIGWLHVAVHDSLGVRRIKSVGYLNADLQKL